MKNLFCYLKIWALAVSACCALAASADVTIWVYYDSESGSVYPNGIGIAKLCVDGQSDILLTNKVTVDGRTWYWHTYKGITNGLLSFKNADNSNESPKLKFKEGDNFYYYTGSRYGINITGVKENAYYYIFERPHKWTDSNPEWFPRAYIYNDDVNPNVYNAAWPGVTMTFIGGKKVDSFGSNDGTGSGVNDDNFTVWAAKCDFQPNGIIFVRGKYNGSSWDNWNQFEDKSPMNYGYYKFNTNDNNFYDGNNVGGLAAPENHYVNMTWPTMVTATLAQIEANPRTDVVYTISDELTVAGRINNVVYAKDDNGAAAQAAGSGEIDYNDVVFNYDNTDHSNWIALTGTDATSVDAGVKLSGVQGVLTDVNNFTLAVADATVSGTGTYNKNNYTPCNFAGTQIGNNDKTYFFAKPQVMEFARINYAVYKGNGTFGIPTSSTGIVNGANLAGSFTADLNGNGSSFTQGNTYNFDGIIKTAAGASVAPRRLVGNGGYTVMVTGGIEEPNIVTGVTHVTAATQVAGVKYVDMAGHVSDRPFTGLNLVVTTMTDGSVHTVKVMK